jgi:hypothetical protein
VYLSYSGFKTYCQCPLCYWHKYVNKTKIPPENGVNALYGSVVGIVFEDFYRDKLWRRPDYLDYMQTRVEPCFDKAIRDQRGGRVYDWADEKSNYHSRGEVVAAVRETIPRGVGIIRDNRLLGTHAVAEMKLDHRFGEHLVGGRSDFVIRRIAPHEDLVILDGKGSKWREKYVDGHELKPGQKIEGIQLKWYGLLHRAQTGIIPDKLGYLFWMFDGAKGIEWITFSNKDLDVLQSEILTTMDRVSGSIAELEKVSGLAKGYDELRQERFPAQAGDHCRLCSYVDLCEDGTKKVASLRRRSRVTLPGPGVVEPGLSLDDE